MWQCVSRRFKWKIIKLSSDEDNEQWTMRSQKTRKPPRTDYSFMNSNESDNVIYGREYLQGLSIRPTKRQREEGTGEAASREDLTCSWLDNYHTSLIWRGYNIAIVAISSILILLTVVIVVSVLRSSKFSSKCQIPSAVISTTADCTPKTKKKKKKTKRRKTPAKENIVAIANNCGKSESHKQSSIKINEEAIKTLKESVIIKDSGNNDLSLTAFKNETFWSGKKLDFEQQEENLVPITPASEIKLKRDDDVEVATDVIVPINTFAKPDLCISRIASRWESKGLSKQKSLELAANFEMNAFFFEQIIQFISSLFSQSIYKLDAHFVTKQQQAERHHSERMNAPEIEKLCQYREQISFQLLNMPSLSRCMCLTLVSRFYFSIADMSTMLPSPNNTLNVIFSNLCSQCPLPGIGQSQISVASLYALGGWSNWVHQSLQSMSCAWVCVTRLVWCAVCLGLCCRYISKSLSYFIIGLIFIPWGEILMISFSVTLMNIFLTLCMIRHRASFDISLTGQYKNVDVDKVKHTIKCYADIIPRYQAISYFLSTSIGIFAALWSIWSFNSRLEEDVWTTRKTW